VQITATYRWMDAIDVAFHVLGGNLHVSMADGCVFLRCDG
jgi:hypothetical protein